MTSLNSASEKANASLQTMEQPGDVRVFQPAKLTEIVEMIDLMGQVSERIREDTSHDMGSGGIAGAQQGGQTSVSLRDQALANLPPPTVMQQKLVGKIKEEIKALNRQAHALSHSAQKGSAYLLNEIYKKIRRFSVLIEELLTASVEMIQRFYIAVFIDHQPLLAGGDSLVRSA